MEDFEDIRRQSDTSADPADTAEPVDNLADHTIMGVLKTVADTKCPKPAPYLRRGTTVDLRRLMVRSDDALYTREED